jgi:hypothetical protein
MIDKQITDGCDSQKINDQNIQSENLYYQISAQLSRELTSELTS